MTRDELQRYIFDHYSTEPDYPWNDWHAVPRHKRNNKWYGVLLQISEKKLGLTGEGIVDVINVKCDPVLIGSLREQSGFSRHII